MRREKEKSEDEEEEIEDDDVEEQDETEKERKKGEITRKGGRGEGGRKRSTKGKTKEEQKNNEIIQREGESENVRNIRCFQTPEREMKAIFPFVGNYCMNGPHAPIHALIKSTNTKQ